MNKTLSTTRATEGKSVVIRTHNEEVMHYKEFDLEVSPQSTKLPACETQRILLDTS